MLEVKGVSKSFQMYGNRADNFKESLFGLFASVRDKGERFQALSNVSFTLKRGEILGIIGHNGAGKSTLLKILSGITTPDTGVINFYAKSASVLDVGAGFHPELTGRDNVYLSAQLLGVSKKLIDEKFDEIVAFSGIGKFVEEPVKNYSAGMYVRLAFAVVANIDADILIFDEVLGVGDAEFQAKVNNYFLEHARTKSFVIVSHNMIGLMKIANRMMMLEAGKVIAEGAVDVVAKYMDNVKAADHSMAARKDANIELNERALNSDVILKRMGVAGRSMGADGMQIFDTDDVEITATLEGETSDIDVVYTINDRFDMPVFGTTTLHPKATTTYTSADGLSHFTCIIPAQTFNKGVFSISIYLIKGKENVILYKPDVLYFAVELDEALKNQYFYDRYPGSIKFHNVWRVAKK